MTLDDGLKATAVHLIQRLVESEAPGALDPALVITLAVRIVEAFEDILVHAQADTMGSLSRVSRIEIEVREGPA